MYLALGNLCMHEEENVLHNGESTLQDFQMGTMCNVAVLI